jgi:hypothetical protein
MTPQKSIAASPGPHLKNLGTGGGMGPGKLIGGSLKVNNGINGGGNGS